MDLHKTFVSAVISGGIESFKKAQERGIKPEFLENPGRAAWEFVVEYYSKYKVLPSVEAIEGKTGVRLDGPPKEPADFYIDEVLNLRLHIQIGQKVEGVVEHLTGRKPQDAYEAYASGLLDIRKEGIAVSRIISLPSLGSDLLNYYDKMKAGVRGVETPWPSVNDSTLGFWPEDFVLYVARLGVGKCVAWDTRIVDPVSGEPCTIQELCSSGKRSRIMTWSKKKGIHESPISAKIDSGTKTCLRIQVVNTGRTVTVTPEHPFLTQNGWVRAEKIEPGTLIALPGKMPFPKEPSCPFPLDKLDIITAALSLGRYCQGEARLLTSDSEVVDMVKGAAKGLGACIHINPFPSKHFQVMLSSLGDAITFTSFWDTAAKVPYFVWRLDSIALTRFFTVLWLCSGRIYADRLTMAFPSETLVDDLQHLLLRLGIQTKKTAEKTTWSLHVLPSQLRTFRRIFPLLRKGRELPEEVEVTSVPPPPKKESTFRKLFRKVGLSAKDDPDWVHSSGIYWDTVDSLVNVGPTRIYDLTVLPTSCFVANDFIVHNTWTLAQIMLHAWAVQKKRVLFVTTEMSKEKILQRTFSLHLKLPYDDLRRGKLSSHDESRLRDSVEQLKEEDGLYIVGGNFDFSMDSLEAAIDEAEPDLCVVDGAYLIRSKGDGRLERAANSFDELKRCAKRNKIPVVASTQFNREAKTNSGDSVSVEKIALSDAAGWNADVIYGLVQTEEMRSANRMVMKPLKFREGVGDDVLCNWNFTTMDFSELQKDDNFSSAAGSPNPQYGNAMSGFMFSKNDDGDDDDGVPF